MNVLKILLAIAAIFSVLSAVSGIQSVYTGRDGLIVTHHNLWGRILAATSACIALGFLYAIHRRILLAWKLGWLVIVVSVLRFIFMMLISGLPAAMVVFAAAGCIPVGIYWARWWRNQRSYFEPTTETPVAPPKTFHLSIRAWLLLGIGAYLAFAAVIGFGLGSLNLPKYRRLAAESMQTTATVTSLECENHSAVRYTFKAGGEEVVGVGTTGAGKPCRELRVGDQLPVWYVPTQPEINSLGEPEARLENELITVWLAATTMPALLIGIWGGSWWYKQATKA